MPRAMRRLPSKPSVPPSRCNHGPQSQPPHRPRHARDEGAGRKRSRCSTSPRWTKRRRPMRRASTCCPSSAASSAPKCVRRPGAASCRSACPSAPTATLATAEDYLRAAFKFTAMGGDCFYCAASLDIQKALCDNHMPIVAHVGLIPVLHHLDRLARRRQDRNRGPRRLGPCQAAGSHRLLRRRAGGRARPSGRDSSRRTRR